MDVRSTLLFTLILLSLSNFVKSDCTYTIFVKTGTIDSAGTDAKISLMLSDLKGHYIYVNDLETWGGIMEPGHNYFENGNLDVFKNKEACLTGPICWMQLTSDGSGDKPGWFVDYVEVFTTGPQGSGSDKKFTLNRWLAKDEPPYSLQVVINYCNHGENDQVKTNSPYNIGGGRLSSVV